MNDHVPYKTIRRRTTGAVVMLNVAGALVTVAYFSVINRLPTGQEPLQEIDPGGLSVSVVILVIVLLAGYALAKKGESGIAEWYEAVRTGAPAAAVPAEVRQGVLSATMRSALLTLLMWLIAGAVAALQPGGVRFFLGVVGVGGLIVTALVYFAHDLLWRPVIPLFFPEGDLSSTRAFRLPVLGKLLIVFLLIGLLPPAILANLAWQRAQALLTAPNPQAVLSNLVILQLLVLIASVIASIGLAVFMTRSITGPLDTLQAAMGRVGQNDFDVRVPVTSNDELGYLAERLNEMVVGLKERELLRAAHRKVEQELAVAWTIQASFLPDRLPHIPGWELAAVLEPARQTSGDFYDVIPLPNDRLGLLVADVADKGTGAALFMALSRTLIRTFAREYPREPAQVLNSVNGRILLDTHSEQFVTVFYGVLDPATGALAYSNAGHNPPYLFGAQGGAAVRPLRRTGMPLGLFEEVTWGQEVVQLAPGDLLVLYSDGVTEAQDSQGEVFGEGRLLEVVQANRGCSAQGLCEALLTEMHNFMGTEAQFDDITLMSLVRHAGPDTG